MNDQDPHLLRGEMLLSQNRHQLAEQEFRQSLLERPDYGPTHAMLALALLYQERLQEAADEAGIAVGLAPEFDKAHYIHSIVLEFANCYPEAQQAIQQAISIDSNSPDNFAQLARIHLAQKKWAAAKEAAQRGLEIDPEHDASQNMLAMALQKLGQPALAIEQLTSALHRNPDDSWSHANLGWALIEQARHQEALQHFAEALRLEPDNESARYGIVTAMKGRYFIYRIVLAYFLWMSKLNAKFMWVIVFAGLIAQNAIHSIMVERPEWTPWLMPLEFSYIAFVLLTWIADPLFNLLLSLNRFGRLALSQDERRAANLVAAMLLLAMFALMRYGWSNPYGLDRFAGVYFLLAIAPFSRLFHAEPGWPRWAIAGIGVVLVACALSLLFVSLTNGLVPAMIAVWPSLLAQFAIKTLGIVGIGSQIATQWIAQHRTRKIYRTTI